MRGTLAASLLAVSLVLSACGGSTKVVTDTQSAASTVSTSSSAPVSSTASSASPTSSMSSSGTGASIPRCVASDLSLSVLGQQGAAGHGELGFALHNTSSHRCHTFGYPGILVPDRVRGPAADREHSRTTHDFFGSAPEVALGLAPGAARPSASA